jgi:hypothetical protein
VDAKLFRSSSLSHVCTPADSQVAPVFSAGVIEEASVDFSAACGICSQRRSIGAVPDKHTGSVDGIEEYEEADATTFMVRGKTYMKTKVKEPSAPAIYK